jgi:hypothetical protein
VLADGCQEAKSKSKAAGCETLEKVLTLVPSGIERRLSEFFFHQKFLHTYYLPLSRHHNLWFLKICSPVWVSSQTPSVQLAWGISLHLSLRGVKRRSNLRYFPRSAELEIASLRSQ